MKGRHATWMDSTCRDVRYGARVLCRSPRFTATALTLLVLMVQTMLRLARVDPGFDPHNPQTFMFSLTGPQWPDAKKQVFDDAVVERLRAVPGVENAAITYSLPMLGSNWWQVFNIPGKTAAHWISVGEFPNAGIVPVTAGYFETLGIPLVKGRYFDRTDTTSTAPFPFSTTERSIR